MNNILLIFFLLINTKEYIVLPLKTFHEENFTQINNSKSFNSEDFLNYWLPNEMYSYLYIGTPKSKIYTFLEFDDYASYMDNSICKFPSKYNNESSSTFISTSNYIVSYSQFSNMCFAKENFSAYANFNLNDDELKNLQNLSFLYAVKPNNDQVYSKLYRNDISITGNSCFHLGFQIPLSSDYYQSWINQLKKNDYIESTYWTIEFNKNKNNNNNKYGLFDIYDEDEYEGNLIIGLPPHKYNPNKYVENIYTSTVAKVRIKNYEDMRVHLWGIVFDQIYFYSSNSTHNQIVLSSIKCKFSLDIKLIEGSKSYLNDIEKDFFNDLYNKSICIKEKIRSKKNGIYFVISCNKNNYDEIKKFPTLYFKSNELEYIFELTYKDLFAINGDKIYFLIIFRPSGGLFTFGKLFFKKYFFTYSFDNKIIGFYNEEKMKELNNNNFENTNRIKEKIIIVILCLFFSFIFIIGFIKIKRRCLSDRQKRINELIDDNYVYMINKAKNNSKPNKQLGIIN